MNDPNAIDIDDDIDIENGNQPNTTEEILDNKLDEMTDNNNINIDNNSNKQEINKSNDIEMDSVQQESGLTNIENETKKYKKKKKSKKSQKKRERISDVIHFRNYKPKCDELQSCIIDGAKYEEMKDEFTELINRCKVLNHDVHDITPKKANWDLKRDVQPQLKQLEYLTQIAIRELIGMIYDIYDIYNTYIILNIYQTKTKRFV